MNDGPSSNPRLRQRAFDAALAAAAGAAGLGLALSLARELDDSGRSLVVTLLVVHFTALAWRRSSPWVAFGVNLVSGIAVVAVGMPPVVLHFAPLLALYTLASQVEKRRSAIGLTLSIAGLIAVSALRGFDEDASTSIGNLVAIVVVWVIGDLVRGRREYIAQLEARTKELEEAREELAHKAAAEERVRIARELHDIVAHSLSVIAVQSGVGAHVMDQRPEEARRALSAIETASRRALGEMRGLLSMLRDGEPATRLPLPGLDDLGDLADTISQSGPAVDLQVDEDLDLPPSMELTAYRVVQESLTNVVKHAEASQVRVVMRKKSDVLTIDITDDGDARGDLSEGHGLTGMRERVEMFGGSLDTGFLPEGGFRVHARVPIGGTP